tara:strand:- start:53 stop:826 length:774 start_codon:yes stop_codon:yes gene_type:complete
MKLLSITQSNTKVKKSMKYFDQYKWQSIRHTSLTIKKPDYASLSLMPDYKICGGAKSGGCMNLCLKSSGFAKIFKSVNIARQKKTEFLLNDRIGFITQLDKELFNFNKKCIANNKTGFVRLNTISDFPFYKTGLMEKYTNLIFIDYTKIAKRLFEKLPKNYFLMFSFSGRLQYSNQVRMALKTDFPISVVFKCDFPETFLGRQVIDGDKSDLNNALSFNKILGLKFKEINKEDYNEFKNNGFIVHEDQLDYYNRKFI